MKVDILKKEQIFKGFFNLFLTKLRFEQFNGKMSETVSRVNVYRGDAVAVLVYNSIKKKFILVRQFRYPIYTVEPENAWTLEIVAGCIENNSTRVATAVQEVDEEIGYKIHPSQLEYIGKCYPSPGGTSERIFLYAVDVTQSDQVHAGGGLDHEAEDIQIEELEYDQVYKKIKNGEICDAKSLLAFNWFRNRQII